jgi:hypothetical protein
MRVDMCTCVLGVLGRAARDQRVGLREEGGIGSWTVYMRIRIETMVSFASHRYIDSS